MSLTPRIDKIQQNYIINGDMRIAQRHNTFVAVTNGAYTLDRWRFAPLGSGGVLNVTQDTDVPTLAQAGYLFVNSMRINVATGQAVMNSTDSFGFEQRVEGYNWANLAQKPFTLSFWVKATIPGTYCVAFMNALQDRMNVSEYTINSANTWQQVVINVDASPAAGSWNYTNGNGLFVRWTLAAGSNWVITTGNSWQTSGFKLITANQVNGMATTGADFRITGVALFEGTLESPTFSTFGKDRNSELQACRRYFWKTYSIDTPVGTATLTDSYSTASDANGVSHHFGTIFYSPEMRVAPTVTGYRISGGGPSATPFTDSDGVTAPFGISIYANSHKGMSAHINGASGAGGTKYGHFTWDAEL